MLNPIFWKKVQGQKHPGGWGIVEHQIFSIKVLFNSSNFNSNWWDFLFKFSNCFEIWQAAQHQCCQAACQFSKWLEYISKLCLIVKRQKFLLTCLWRIHVSQDITDDKSGYGLVPSSIKPLPQPMFTGRELRSGVKCIVVTIVTGSLWLVRRYRWGQVNLKTISTIPSH